MQKINAWVLWIFGILASVIGTPEMVQKIYAAFQTALSHTPAGDIHLAPWVTAVSSIVGALIAHYIYVRNPSASDPVKTLHSGVLKKLTLLLLVGFAFALAAPSFAYDFSVPSHVFKSAKVKKLSAIPSGLDENAVVLIPTAALAVGTVSTSYGLSASYSLLWCHVKGDASTSTSNLTSYVGLGASVYGDFGDWLKSDFQENPRLKAGVGVILPAMCGITPGVMEVWDIGNGGRSTVVTMNVPLNLLNSLIVKL